MFNMREMFQLAGKTVAVTGPTGYLGPIFIEACAQMGADIAAIGRPQSEEKLSALCERIKTTYHVEAKHYTFDILNEESVEACAQSIKKDFGHIDGLINCAGVNCHGSVAEYTIEDYERLMTINICGTFNVSKHFGAIMCNDKKGSIVNVASFGGTIVTLPPRTMSGYCTSKAGVIHLTRTLAGEFGEHNVRVNSISPGYLEHVFVGRSVGGAEKPNALGTLIGAMLVSTLENGLTICAVPYYVLPAVKGAVLALALVAAYATKKEQ